MSPFICQINLQTHFGGGEVFTAFVSRALNSLGISTLLLHHPDATFWRDLDLPASTTLRAITKKAPLPQQLPAERCWVLTHGPVPVPIAQLIAANHLLTGIAHMPPQGRTSDRYEHYHLVFGVSAYVVQGLRAIGAPVWDAPLYGVADLQRTPTRVPIRQTSCYDWDRRKGRDMLLGWMEPLVEPLRRRPLFERRPGITLGVVSRLTPIKQFPQLFEITAPIIAERPNLNLEIFGAGGYASVRDLRRATAILGHRVCFWGHQRDVASIYRKIDYLMTGLPEKEALGLNVIEAQACGTPVLGVHAPPFDETVLDGKTGILYMDPRIDGGRNFGEMLDGLANHPLRILHDVDVQKHLALFSTEAFGQRIAGVVDYVRARL